MIGDKAETRQKIDEWFEKHSGEMKDDLAKLVAIRSVKGAEQEGAPYGAAPREALKLAEVMLDERGFNVSVFEDIVISADLGPAPPQLGILAHLDIVDEGEGWDTDPFGMTEKDGILYGRGVIDNKGPAVASMYALYCARDLLGEVSSELRQGVRLILGSGEETGFDDITRYLARNEPPPSVFSPDSEFPVVNIEKGRFAPFFGASWDKDDALPRVVSLTGGKTMNIVPQRAEAVIEGMELSVAEAFCSEYSAKTGVEMTTFADGDMLIIKAEGKASHAARPALGNNAQTALLGMLAAMPFAESAGFGYIKALNRLFPHGDYYGKSIGIAMSDETTGELTASFCVLRFSMLEFAGNFDCRSPACADDADLVGITGSAFKREGINITSHSISQCHHTPEGSPFVQTLLQVYEDYTGNPRECLGTGGQTYVHDIPGGVVFGCAMPGEDNKAHGANEYISADKLILSARMFTQVILDMCGRP